MQNHLLGQLLEDRGIGHLISSLSMLLATTAVLFDRNGQVVAQAQARAKLSESFLKRTWDVYQERRPEHVERQSFVVGDNRVDYREVSHRSRVEEVLCLARPRSQSLPDFTEVILSYAQKLLTLDLLRSQDSLLLRKRMQTGLLEELVAGTGHPKELAERARHHGFDPELPWRVMVVRPGAAPAKAGTLPARPGMRGEPEPSDGDFGDLLARLDAALSEAHVGFLSLLRGEEMLVLMLTDDPLPELKLWLEKVCASLQQQMPARALHAGLSESYRGVDMIPAALEQACEALAAWHRCPKRVFPPSPTWAPGCASSRTSRLTGFAASPSAP